jgi:hypothetical protein
MGSFYRSAHELIFLFKNRGASHRNNVQLGKFGRYRTNVWNYPSANTFSRSGPDGDLLALHPTPNQSLLLLTGSRIQLPEGLWFSIRSWGQVLLSLLLSAPAESATA